jgi:hypothetical protein
MKRPLFLEARTVTPVLAAAGVALIVFYIYCATSCAYLKGSILGLDLKYLGLIYLGAVVLLCLARREMVLTLLLSFGMGSEVFLIGYQVNSGVYCPYCLGFALIIVLMFAANFDGTKIRLMVISSLAGFAVFMFFFSGSLTPAYADENGGMTSFGSGPVNVRLYTDYFCAPCSALEDDLEGVIVDLVQQKTIRITFIDTPIHRDTPLYAKYFLYILNENSDFKQAMKARNVLFEAAATGIINSGELESFLTKKGVKFRPFDVVPIFRASERYMRTDRITSTPTCVIAAGNERQVFTTAAKILEALKGYRNRK